ncbi:MAG: hypothetical protein R3F65_02760 [bacterium]
MRAPLRPALLGLALLAAGCQEPDEEPIIILPDEDAAVDAAGPDAVFDAAPDATPSDGPLPDMPSCLDPCDDFDPWTTADRCVDGACLGEPLPAMLALVADVPPIGGATLPAAEVVAVRVEGGAPVVAPTGARAPRAFYGGEGALWATRPLDAVDSTAVLRWDPAASEFAPRTHRAPLVPGARVVPLAGEALALVGSDGGVVHVTADGIATALGVGAADETAFFGWLDGRLVGRTLGAEAGEPWAPEDADLAGVDAAAPLAVVGGFGFVRGSEALAVVDIAGRRVAGLALAAPPRIGPPALGARWAVAPAGDAVVDLSVWPPRLHRLASAWVDARVVAGAVVAIDGEGAVWRSTLGDDGPAPLDRQGALAPGATIFAVAPDGALALAGVGESRWAIRAEGGAPVVLPPLAATFAGFGPGHVWFTAPGRVDALDRATLTAATRDDPAIGAPLGVVGEALLVRHATPAPATLVRSGPDGATPVASVWIPERADLSGEAAPRGVITSGRHAVFFEAGDGPLMALDLQDPAAVPIPIARINNRPNALDAQMSPDGRWVVWRAGDALLGTLRGARVTGEDYPDGVGLWQSRQYPALMAPNAARLTVQVAPGPTTGIPVVELDDPEPDEGLFVLVPGQGTYPLTWIDDDALLYGACFGEGCPAWGLGVVRLFGEQFDVRPLIDPDPAVRRPEWGATAMATPADVYFVRDTARQLLVQRVPIGGNGPWMTVTNGAPDDVVRLWGPVEQGLLFELGAGRAWYAPPTGVAVELALPSPAGLRGLGPTGPGRPPVVMAAGEAGAGCADCGAWRLDVHGGDPLRLGSAFDGPLRPFGWSPDGLAVVHHGLDASGRLRVQLTGAHRDEHATVAADGAADVRFVGWLAE